MMIYELNPPETRQVLLDGTLNIKTTEIREKVEGEILNTIARKLTEINYNRFRNCKRQVNTIVMSPYLYKYIEYLVKGNLVQMSEYLKSQLKELFGLKIIVRDDYEIDEIDFYRDVTKEI